MRLYINDGRFGELVKDIFAAEEKRRMDEAIKENDRKWWELYLRSNTEKTFIEWRRGMEQTARENARPGAKIGKRDIDMTDQDLDTLLKRLFPDRAKA